MTTAVASVSPTAIDKRVTGNLFISNLATANRKIANPSMINNPIADKKHSAAARL
jgi:hypothetical protein